jgi:hypothetical protein
MQIAERGVHPEEQRRRPFPFFTHRQQVRLGLGVDARSEEKRMRREAKRMDDVKRDQKRKNLA